eukprot:gene39647-48372_t
MKKARFTDEQIVRILQEADRDPIAAVAKRHGVGESSIYVWRKRFGDMGTDDVKRLRNLEQENSRLKKILAERDLEIEARYAIERGVSQRRACALLQVARSGLTYTCKMPIKDAPIVQAMRHYSDKYPRFGARRVRIFLRRDGIALGRDRTARIWAKHGLQVPAKKTKKRYRPERTQIGAPSRPNEVWSYDFVFDAC